MTDTTDPAVDDETAGADEPSPPVVTGLRRTRKVLWISVAVAVPVFLLVLVLANGEPAATRAVKSPLVGKPAPPIEGTTVDGADASLTSLEGKWVVVNFFATWCVPCRQEHPELIRFAQSHQGAGDAAVLGVVYSDNAQAVREFRDKEGGDWPMLADPKGRIALDYGVAGIPESFLVSPEGVVVAKLLGGVRATDLDQVLYRAKTGQ
ncbi:MAG TPA: TlpA disulfide reductase family protein [Acidimicrobiales bacterium]|nr:TlpA disulfide reductase family protein [Acidimicrobiales bacterium]